MILTIHLIDLIVEDTSYAPFEGSGRSTERNEALHGNEIASQNEAAKGIINSFCK